VVPNAKLIQFLTANCTSVQAPAEQNLCFNIRYLTISQTEQ